MLCCTAVIAELLPTCRTPHLVCGDGCLSRVDLRGLHWTLADRQH